MANIKILMDKTSVEDLHVNGNIYIGEELNDYTKISQSVLNNNFKDLEGCFSIIKNTEKSIFSCCDKFGSYSIFYYYTESVFIISDSIDKIIPYISTIELDSNNIELYKNMGFVPGNGTFIKNVCRLMAGQKLTFEKLTMKLLIEDYQDYASPYDEHEEVRLQTYTEFKSNFYKLAKKLKPFYQGKKIMLPLSDGSDSKLLASLLFLMEGLEVEAYTYGKKTSDYVRKSEEIAKNLGFKWKFYEYSKLDWESLRKNELFTNYLHFSGKLCQFTHFQDFLAVKEISDIVGDQRDDIIFLPGHTGVIGGGNLNSDFFSPEKCSWDSLKKYIIHRDCNLLGKGSKIIKNIERINDLALDEYSYEELISFFQKWDMQERQSKMIISSVSVYEFFGFKWDLPLIYKELSDYFYDLNIKWRIDKLTYKNYVNKLYMELLERDAVPEEIAPKKYSGPIKMVLKKGYERLALTRQLFNHDLSWFSLFFINEKITYICNKGYGFPSIIASIYVKEVKKKIDFVGETSE